MARLTLRSPVFVLACAGGVVPRWCPPIGRRIGSPSLRHLHYPAVAPGPAVSYQSFGAASVLGGSTPSRGPRGAGAHGYPGTPDRRPLGAWPNCRPCAEWSPPKFIDGLSQTVMGRGDGDVVCGGANARELGFARVILWSLACSRGLNGACWYTSEHAKFFNPSYRRT